MPRPARSEREARELAQALLGLISLLVWFGLSFGVAIALQLNSTQNSRIMMVGGVSLLVAALPWLAYRQVVAWARRR